MKNQIDKNKSQKNKIKCSLTDLYKENHGKTKKTEYKKIKAKNI